jgi:hypothetical protein
MCRFPAPPDNNIWPYVCGTKIQYAGEDQQQFMSVSQKDRRPTNRKTDSLGSSKTIPYVRQLVADFPPRRPGFEPGSGHVGFVVNIVALA